MPDTLTANEFFDSAVVKPLSADEFFDQAIEAPIPVTEAQIQSLFGSLPPDPNAPQLFDPQLGQQPSDISPGIQDLIVQRPLNFRPGEDRGVAPPRFIKQGLSETTGGLDD